MRQSKNNLVVALLVVLAASEGFLYVQLQGEFGRLQSIYDELNSSYAALNTRYSDLEEQSVEKKAQ